MNIEQAQQKRLFTKPDDVKLDEVVKEAVAQELSEQSAAVVRGSSSSSQKQSDQVNKVKQPKKAHPQSQQQQKSNVGNQSSPRSCQNCGSKQHTKAQDCPQKDVVCLKCKKNGHFAMFCRSTENRNSPHTSQTSNSAKVVDTRTATVHSST
ncbi:unnamed protein product [Orchesella dallaii]|uniref:CCHC-type domain-containing protein n=1 Tax=Orchesella dallaii TaxID=48710 RepID=A0ABP1Q1P9_9HEXA